MKTPHHLSLWLLGAAIAALAACVILDGLLTYGRSAGHVIDVLALEGDEALTIHRARGNSDLSVLRLQDERMMISWQRVVPYVPIPSLGERWINESSGVVILRAHRGLETPLISAFDLSDGRRLWTSEPMRGVQNPGGGGFLTLYAGSLSDRDQHLEFYTNARFEWSKVISTDLETGVERWRRELDSGYLHPVWLRLNHLVVTETLSRTVRIIDRSSGEDVEALAFRDDPCLAHQTMFLGRDDGIFRFELDRQELQRIPLEPRERGGRVRFAGRCGRFGDTVILGVTFGGGESALVAFDHQSYQERWRLELNAELARIEGRRLRLSSPDHIPFSGELTRFVPVQLSSRDSAGGNHHHLAMIDVEEGEVVWTSPHQDELLHSYLLRHRQYHYLLYGAGGMTLTVFDGTTGEMGRSVLLPLRHQLRPSHFAGDLLWMIWGDEAWPLDAVTLEPTSRPEGDGSLRDSRPRMVELLGLEG